jgi:PRTRC genetic system protein A
MAPRFGDLEPANRAGERIIVASNGIFVEITRKWARFIRRVGELNTPVPYGTCEESFEWLATELPSALLRDFQDMARRTPATEIGAGIVWNETTGAYRLLPVVTLEASGAHLKYKPPALGQGDHLIVDCHSHGRHPAFFSRTDNEDDRYDVKIAYVVGDCGKPHPTTATRLCLKGIFENIELE